jgi:hypothetical protein
MLMGRTVALLPQPSLYWVPVCLLRDSRRVLGFGYEATGVVLRF